MKRVSLNVSSIRNWENFHDLFSAVFKFPHYYGRNLNAWIDVMSDPDIAGIGYFIHLEGADQMKTQCPDIFTALIECAAFVNYRCHEAGDEGPIIALSYHV
jgi:RNAse (barnase) inhibitor barstar